MTKTLLDTDILSEILRGVNPRVMRRAEAYVAEHRVLTISSITVFEIVAGLEQRQAEAQMRRALAAFQQNEEIAPNPEDFRLPGRIVGTLRRSGIQIGYSDPLIAAIALSRNLTVVTGNRRHFGAVQDVGFPLLVDNWRDD